MPAGPTTIKEEQVPTWGIVVAFAALYLIWGSTYLAIKVAIETIPPFLMSAGRFLLAGTMLYGVARWRGVPRPTKAHWKHSLIVGSLLMASGNAVVAFAERWIDSGMAALLIASNPLFMSLFGWWGGVQSRPTPKTWLSLFGGFAGVIMLLSWGEDGLSWGEGSIGYVWILLAVISWTGGSIYSKRHPQTLSPWLQSGMQMICGGMGCLLLGAVVGEYGCFSLEAVSMRSWVAFVYLILLGSLAGFTSYVYLLKHCSPSVVSSHAYVNPVVAVLLGWLLLGETLTVGGMAGSSLILVSVYMLLKRERA